MTGQCAFLPQHKGYKYKDKALGSDGILLMLMKGGGAGRSKARVKGKAIPLGAAGNLNGSLSAIVQLFGSDAPECIFITLPTVLKDDGVQFKAKKRNYPLLGGGRIRYGDVLRDPAIMHRES